MFRACNMAKAALVGVALFGSVACACGGSGVECKPADVRAEDYPSVAAAVCASRGGGRVTVGPGVTRSIGPVVLRSNVELHLVEGATIEFSDSPEDYMPGVPVSWEGVECYNLSPLVYAYGCTNVAITGRGVLKAKNSEGQAPGMLSENRDERVVSARYRSLRPARP